ncbi:MAG: thioredoxin fold domain-containing protein [Salinisphaeraceae bacterium]|nr:thioredoxin fold domain-containing protein [Salinisphaeraceae bacterium]
MKLARLLILIFLFPVHGLAEDSQDDLATFQANVAKRLTGDYKGYATPYTGIYSLTWPDDQEAKTPVLSDVGLTMLANSFSEAWAYFGKGNPKVEADKVKAIRARAAAELPLQSAIIIRRADAPISIAVYSAVDCGYCRRLEAFLAQHEISYAVFPGSLSLANFSLARDVWCNPDPAEAWLTVMHKEEPIPTVAACEAYPITDIRYTGALFSYGNTPGIIFADGDVIARLPEGPDEEAEFLQIIEAKIKKGAVFTAP